MSAAPLRTVVVEDEPLARRTLRDFVAAEPALALVGEAADGAEAVRLLDALAPDLVLLDVTLPEASGLEVLDRVARRPPAVVFTTAYEQFAVAAFEREVVDYLLKPVSRARFAEAVARVMRRLGAGRAATPEAPPAAEPLTRVFARHGRELVPVRLAEVTRLEADGDFAALHVGGRRLLVSLSLAECARRLDPARFRRVHRSHVVNLDHVVRVTRPAEDERRLVLHLADGSRVTTSRTGARALDDLIA